MAVGFSQLISRAEITSDSSSRNGRKIDRFIIHHAATTILAGILALFQPGGRTVSGNYALGGGVLVGCVDEDRRAWTSASEHWDGRAVTIEVANSRAGDPWPVAWVDFALLARLIADVATRHAFPIDDTHVLTHQELWLRYGDSYATACPGDLQRRKAELLDLARQFQREQIAPEPETPKEITMKLYHREDATARAEGRVLRPGEGFYLHDEKGKPSDHAKNVVGGDGPYGITVHVYAEGTPGDAVDVKLVWQDTKATPPKISQHYVERIEIGTDGTARRSVTFQRSVERGYAVFARLSANRTNSSDVLVTLLDTDAALFRAA